MACIKCELINARLTASALAIVGATSFQIKDTLCRKLEGVYEVHTAFNDQGEMLWRVMRLNSVPPHVPYHIITVRE